MWPTVGWPYAAPCGVVTETMKVDRPMCVKRVVRQVIQLVRRYVASLVDPEMLRRIEKTMADESKTIRNRQATIGARQGARA